MHRIEVVTGRDLAGLETTWRRLLQADPVATVFQTWEWNHAWWRSFGSGRRLLALVAHGHDGPLALAPLALRRGPCGLFRRVEFLGTGVSDYLGFIGPSNTMAECVRAFLDTLAQKPDWDVVDLQQLNPAHLGRIGCGSDPAIRRRQSDQALCPVMDLPPTWDEVLQRVGKKMRSNIRYYERLLERELHAGFELADEESVGEALEDFLRLHAQRWRRRGLPGALYTHRLREFHRALAPALVRSGNLALHRLKTERETIAALYCFRHGARLFYYLGGFDPRLARYSPGTVLTAHVIRWAVEQGCREFDFLRGREEYKYRWPVEDRPNCRVEMARVGSARGGVAMWWNSTQQRLQEAAQAALERA